MGNTREAVTTVATLLLVATGCSSPYGEAPLTSGPRGFNATPLHAVDNPSLQNLLRVSESIYSGGEPLGDASFTELARLGVRTVVSVDGAKPDVEGARKHGLRYVHIPVGYDGVSDESGRALARLVREAEGPFYFHCHHGRHRGPAAAAVACIAAGEADNVEARRILELAGTSRDYGGLWRDVGGYTPPPGDAELPELVEVAEVGSFAAAMALVDRAYDNLKLCRDADWSTPYDHPDLVPSHEALLLREGFHESGRILTEDAEARLRSWLTEAEDTAHAFEAALRAGDLEAAAVRFDTVVKSCKRCHAKYRN